jgi:hypothetical protein
MVTLLIVIIPPSDDPVTGRWFSSKHLKQLTASLYLTEESVGQKDWSGPII